MWLLFELQKMSDIIKLLPDSVANQIAAGEVIQRPASAVKELIENAVDSGADHIRLIVKNSGKTLIQVIDNGCGMSETDARMSFERHATSKLSNADDLFSLRTKGFRGEALASIAAIAQVELKTRRKQDELGTLIQIEGSKVINQEATSCPIGSSLSVKNLFFNVPARRNFLKSDSAELRHIIEEFQRIALAHSDISMTMHHNDTEVFNLEKGSLKQRIIGIFGKNYNEKIAEVEEITELISIKGYTGKPEFAKKTRGEQYFFVNNRFIKSSYLHHAVQSAYEGLLPEGEFPSYYLFIEMDPRYIDINIHPTKTEVKFENERGVYMILRSAVKRSIGRFNLSPTIDFEVETSFNIPLSTSTRQVQAPTIKVDPSYNPFEREKFDASSSKIDRRPETNWEDLFKINASNISESGNAVSAQSTMGDSEDAELPRRNTYQLHHKYILSHIKSGLMIIHQQNAHERILYERFIREMANNSGRSQKELFPGTIDLSPQDFELLKELKESVNALGFEIEEFGKNTFIIHGVPAEATNQSPADLLESLIENYKQNLSEIKINTKDNIARSLAKKMAVSTGNTLSTEEMNSLIDQLFGCENPYITPTGIPTIYTISLDELDKKFSK